MASKKASGRNVKESERGTEAKKFRLDHEVAQDIEELAEKIGCTQSHFVEAAVVLFEAAMNGEDVSELVHELIERAAAVSEAEEDEAGGCDCKSFKYPHPRGIAGCIHDKG